MTTKSRDSLFAVALCAVIGCDSENSGPMRDDAATEPIADGGGRDSSGASGCGDDRVGGFGLFDDELDGAVFSGSVFEQPLGSGRDVTLREGACTLYRLAPQVDCGSDGSCPAPLSVGLVTVSGLAQPLTAAGPRYLAIVEQGGPSSEEGAAITLEATGGDYDPFALHAIGVGQLAAPPEQDLVVEAGKAVMIEWDPASASTESRMRIELRTSEQEWVECDVPDAGAFEISGALVTALLDLGPSLTHGVTLTRFSQDATVTDLGCVDFTVTSKVAIAIAIPSLIMCESDEQCPDGQTCRSNYVCR